jgi:hypothetical protein
MFEAIEEKLGSNWSPRGLVEVLVLQNAERPTENSSEFSVEAAREEFDLHVFIVDFNRLFSARMTEDVDFELVGAPATWVSPSPRFSTDLPFAQSVAHVRPDALWLR